MNRVEEIENYLEELFPDPKCELLYQKDYELLIAVVLSAQSTDKRVNAVTPILFAKYKTLEQLKEAPISDLATIIHSVGSYHKKAEYIHGIATRLVEEFDGKVPNDREILESFPGVGRKTTNVVLSLLFDVPAIAVDTHVERISKRLGLAKEEDNVREVEQKLMRKYDRQNWSRRHYQMVLFGRYYCKAVKPECEHCALKNICKRKDTK